MCWTKIEVGLVISIFIYSDPVPVFLISICCFVLSLARAAHFIKWSKWQGRAILESGSFLYHMKTLCQHARGVHHTSTKENMALQRVWEGRNKERHSGYVKKNTNIFFLERWLWLISKLKSVYLWKFSAPSILVRDIGVDHWKTEAAHWFSSVLYTTLKFWAPDPEWVSGRYTIWF